MLNTAIRKFFTQVKLLQFLEPYKPAQKSNIRKVTATETTTLILNCQTSVILAQLWHIIKIRSSTKCRLQ